MFFFSYRMTSIHVMAIADGVTASWLRYGVRSTHANPRCDSAIGNAGICPQKKAEEGKCLTLRIVIRWLFEVHLTQKFGCHGMEQIWEFHPCRWPQPPATRRIQQLGVIASSNFGELRGIQLLAPQQSWDWLPHDRHVFIHEYPRVLSNDSPYDLETWK